MQKIKYHKLLEIMIKKPYNLTQWENLISYLEKANVESSIPFNVISKNFGILFRI